MMLKLFLKKLLIAHIPALFAVLFVLAYSTVMIMAFEAHVINVTATIERPPTMCNALSVGYWRNHDGCAGGEGESDWTNEIHSITTEFSGIFYNITGAEICEALWIPDCPSGNNILSKRCKATAMALGDELNLVSGRLDLDALIAGADDGSAAFDHLGLTYNSTVRDALTKVEQIIGNPNSTTQQLTDAAYVAERIYAFYEDENANAPYCVKDPIGLPLNIALFSVSSPSSDEENSSTGESGEGEEGGNQGGNGNNNSEKSGGDGRGNSDEHGAPEATANESGQDAALTGETATSTGETATSSDDIITSTEEGGGEAGQNATSSESTEPTATSSAEQVSP